MLEELFMNCFGTRYKQACMNIVMEKNISAVIQVPFSLIVINTS